MYSFKDIKTIHLEVTTRCNASCPMCARNLRGGGVNPKLKMTELSTRDIQKILPIEILTQLKRIYICGNFGDPAAAQDTLDIFQYFRLANPNLRLGLHSNGSIRSSSWWASLGKIVDYCHFGIDGLEDTNHIYRRGTLWPKIIENVRAFISARHADAMWDYLVFRHNEHQVEKARALAKDMGFSSFSPKKTGRFYSNKTQDLDNQFQVLSKNGEIEYYLEPPTNPQYLNSSYLDHASIKERYGSLEQYYEKTAISCKVAQEKSLYISAEGLVFPCCWTANQMFTYSVKSDWHTFVERFPQGISSVNSKVYSLQEIVDGPIFQNLFPASWNRDSFDSGRLRVCAKTCGSEMDLFKKQF